LQRLNREAVTALIVAEMLTQGVFFDSRSLLRIPANRRAIFRSLHALIKAGVVTKSKARTKYLLTDEFLEVLRQEITRGMPRGNFVHFPDLSVFEVCGIGSWSADELQSYQARLEKRWMLRKGF